MASIASWRSNLTRNFSARTYSTQTSLAALRCLLLATMGLSVAGCFSGDSGRPKVTRQVTTSIASSDLVGRWKMKFINYPSETDFVLIEISQPAEKGEGEKGKAQPAEANPEGKLKLTLLDTESSPVPVTLKSSTVEPSGKVRFEVAMGDAAWSYHGQADGEFIWGTLLLPHFQLGLAKMERTEEKTIDRKKEPEKIPAVDRFAGASHAADRYVALYDFVRAPDHNRSPLLAEAYAMMANEFKAEKIEEDKVKSFVSDFHEAIDVWGERWAPRVEMEVGRALAAQQLYPELAREYLTKAQAAITDDYPYEWKLILADAWVNLGDHGAALKILQPLRELDDSSPSLRLTYARAKEKAGDVDEALKIYAGLATLPQFESNLSKVNRSSNLVLPSEAAASLWKKKHGDTSGLDAYLNEAYDNELKYFIPKRTPEEKRPDDAQVTLIEFFTGAACQPCVAADIAAESFRKSYSNQELILIKYHEHSPLPDPLSNEAMIQRFTYYQGRGTPTMLVNAQLLEGAGGFVQHAPSLIGRLKLGIDAEQKKTTPVKVKVSATRKADDIAIEAAVSGIEKVADEPALILVLIENGIRLQAPNGIRLHNCVARAFADGPTGIKLKAGENTHQQTISLVKVREDINKHLTRIQESAGSEFAEKPLDLKSLQIVAIVQDVKTRVYVQSAICDVVDAP